MLASTGHILGQVVYAGKETRMAMNTSEPRQKVGKLDEEVNSLTKWLFVLMLVIALVIMAANGFPGTFGEVAAKYFRIMLLLCSIIPISMRINLDFAKIWYSYGI